MSATLGRVVATSAGLLPERLDLTHVLAAYGAGTIPGQAVGSCGGLIDPATPGRRDGVGAIALSIVVWTLALIGALADLMPPSEDKRYWRSLPAATSGCTRVRFS